jgi:hypothetical protein
MKKAILLLLLPGMLFAQNITLVMTVDWEGRSISLKNISAIGKFRSAYPEIPMLHFLNPGYFTKDYVDADLKNIINAVIRPEDERGLHIHAWKSLVQYCGINYQSKPTFADIDENCSDGKECGHTVSLEYAYSQPELSQLIKCSQEILANQGFGEAKSFRAGGWQLGTKLAQALTENNITLDSSRTDGKVLIPQWGENSNLVQMVLKLHPTASSVDQPFELLPGLMELPNNGCLADYTPASTLLKIFKENVKAGKRYFVTGFHLETADAYLPQLEKGLAEIKKYALENKIQINWAPFPLEFKN